MALFKREKITSTEQELTPEIAEEIYALFVAGKDETRIFTENGYSIADCKKVFNEAKRIEAVGIEFIKANPDCTAGQVVSAISSDLLTEATVGADIIKFTPVFKVNRTFAEFKSYVLE